MDGGSTISSDAVVALSRAIDAARDRGDMDEAIRLASLQGAELNRWLEAHGYPGYGTTAPAPGAACLRPQHAAAGQPA